MEGKTIGEYATDYFNNMYDPYGSYLEITGAYEAGASKQAELQKIDEEIMLDFAAWFQYQGWRIIFPGRRYKHIMDNTWILSGEELFELYKQEVNGTR